MDNKVDVSIIITTYNCLLSLSNTIDSYLNTNYHTETIVGDDGSTDGTWEWLLKQINITMLSQSQLGKCWAVNNDFKIANGKYIKFLNSDDIITNNANDDHFELTELTSVDVVVSGNQNFNNDDQLFNKQPWIETDDFIGRQLGEGNNSHYSAYLLRKQFLDEIPRRPDLAYRNDRLFLLKIALKNPNVIVHPGISLLLRFGHGDCLQISSDLKQQVQHFRHLNIYKRFLRRLRIKKRLTERSSKASISILWPLAQLDSQKKFERSNRSGKKDI